MGGIDVVALGWMLGVALMMVHIAEKKRRYSWVIVVAFSAFWPVVTTWLVTVMACKLGSAICRLLWRILRAKLRGR